MVLSSVQKLWQSRVIISVIKLYYWTVFYVYYYNTISIIEEAKVWIDKKHIKPLPPHVMDPYPGSQAI